MKIRKDPYQVWEEYQRGVQYKTSIELYENVKRNNNFFNDKQWEGVRAPDLDKPVFNILKPVVNYYTAMLISDDIAVNVELMGSVDDSKKVILKRQPSLSEREREEREAALMAGLPVPGMENMPSRLPQAGGVPMIPTPAVLEEEGIYLASGQAEFGMDEAIPKIVSREVDDILEHANVRFKNRRMIRNCAVDGDACFYMWFDPDVDTGFDYKGRIKVDLLDNTNVYFGDPSNDDTQEQPYIILSYRRLTEDVKDEAKENGLSAELVVPDDEERYVNGERDAQSDYTTVLLKMWKQNGTVHIMKCTQKALVKKETDTEYKLYPIAWMSWEAVKNSYHGVSPITGKINNQIFINKIYALAMRFVANNAFPKIVYDRTKLPQGWNNDVNKAVGVAGDPNTAILSGFRPPDMSADAMNMAAMTMKETKDLMGASDAALGNVKPDNTSAIVAVQKAAGLPLDIQRMDFHNFVEDYVRVFIEMMRVNYGVRNVCIEDSESVRLMGEFDFGLLNDYALNLKIDIGAGSYWSELMQVQTLDNLMAQQILPDALTYLEAVPDGYIKDKHKIMERIKQMQGGQGGMPMPQMAGAGMPPGMGAPAMGSGMPQELAMDPSLIAGQPQEEVLVPDMAPPEEIQEVPDLLAEIGPLDENGRLKEEQFTRLLQVLMDMPAQEVLPLIDLMEIAPEDKDLLKSSLEKWSDGQKEK